MKRTVYAASTPGPNQWAKLTKTLIRQVCPAASGQVFARDSVIRGGEANANLVMRLLRSVLNFALAHYEHGFGKPLLTENPVQRLTRTRAWYRAERRQTVIKIHQLPAWYKAVDALRSDQGAFGETVAVISLHCSSRACGARKRPSSPGIR